MLEPQNRQLLINSLQPPLDFRLDRAVCTSYSLDLVALLSAPVAFAFADAQDREGRPLMDPLALLKATREYASRMLLFHHPGKIHVPKSYQSLLLSMEDSIAEAIALNGGSFHPKVFFLRFVGNEEVRYRILCLSRNLTFDRSWDTSLCLEGSLKDRTNAISINHPLGDFLEALPGMCPRGISKDWKKQIEQMVHEVRRVEFELPAGFDSLRFWPIGIGKPKEWPFEERCDRLLIVSPFVSSNLLQEFTDLSKSVQLVSRDEQLAMLPAEALKPLTAVWTLDDTAQMESEANSVDSLVDDTEPQDSEVNADNIASLAGLHAKVYVIDRGWNASVLTGSANATHSAFHRNVEFLTELTGKKKFCGIDAVLGVGKGEQDTSRVHSFGDLLVPYEVDDDHIPEQDSEREFEIAVDDLAKQIAERVLATRSEPMADANLFRLTLHPTRKRKSIQTDYEVSARLMSNSVNRWFKVNFAVPDWLLCDSISLVGLTSFFVFRVLESTTGAVRQFVVNAPLTNPPVGRHEALLQSILLDSDRVQRFLMLLLGDGDATQFMDVLAGHKSSAASNGIVGSTISGSLFETLMKALTGEPDKIREAARVVEELRSSEEGCSRLPDGFPAIWDPIFAAWSSKQSNTGKNRGPK
jgi:hypothetical protein